MICCDLQQIISRKDTSPTWDPVLANYMLIIMTDEFAFGHVDVARFIEGAVFRALHITDAFLGLSYVRHLKAGSARCLSSNYLTPRIG